MNEDAAEFARLGLYDPEAPDAEGRLALLRFNAEHGITLDEMVEAHHSGRLPYVVADPLIRGEGSRLTLAEAAERSGLAPGQVVAMWRAAGFAEPGPEDRVFSESNLGVLSLLAMAEALFGSEVTLQLVRVMGSAMARIAEAEIMAFGVQVAGKTSTEGWSELDVARLHVDVLGPMLPQVAGALDMLHRHHLDAVSRRLAPDPFDPAIDRKHLAVGFADLCGFTELSHELTAQELSAAVGGFEGEAADLVSAGGGRVVKLIGDEVMFAAPNGEAGCRIAARLVGAFRDHPTLPPVRASVAAGDVLLFEGDYFGPVVNLAARLMAVSGPGEIVVPAEVGDGLGGGWEVTGLGARALKGFPEPVEVARVVPESS